MLVEPFRQHAVAICPNFWSVRYKSISYLRVNVSFADANGQYFSVDLFCRPYFGFKSSNLVRRSKFKV